LALRAAYRLTDAAALRTGALSRVQRAQAALESALSGLSSRMLDALDGDELNTCRAVRFSSLSVGSERATRVTRFQWAKNGAWTLAEQVGGTRTACEAAGHCEATASTPLEAARCTLDVARASPCLDPLVVPRAARWLRGVDTRLQRAADPRFARQAPRIVAGARRTIGGAGDGEWRAERPLR
jgi:hypothetical protein